MKLWMVKIKYKLLEYFKVAKEELRQKDYETKIKKYEEVYGEKLDYTFNIEKDIAGWN